MPHQPQPTQPPAAAPIDDVASSPSIKYWARRAFHFVYGVYALTLLAVLMPCAGLLALIVPWLSWRRVTTRALAQLWLRAAGLMPRVAGLDVLPAGSCVLVANHSSYLDGVLMKAVLPPRFSFVIKREAAAMPVVGFLLRRIGSQFVDRSSHGGRQRDARRVMKHAAAGHALVFFPEGTFDDTIGLKRFHVGAFVAAVRGNVPLVPCAIRGARLALPNGALMPYPRRIEIEILEPLTYGPCGSSVEQLREAARQRILERLGEPDLGSVAPQSTTGVQRAVERA